MYFLYEDYDTKEKFLVHANSVEQSRQIADEVSTDAYLICLVSFSEAMQMKVKKF